MIFFKVNDKFLNTSIIFVNSAIQGKKIINIEELHLNLLVDEKMNVKLINLFTNNLITNKKNYSILQEDQINDIIQKILKYQPNLIFHTKETYALGKIVQRNKHPKSDKLAILKVDFKNFEKQIITNTTYSLENMYFLFALEGFITFNAEEIKESKVLDNISQGMILSSKSLNLSIENDKLTKILNDEKIVNKYWGNNIKKLLNDLQEI
ncbi:hypothetical protein VBM87_02505 [Mycoplasma sp. 744]|uniref:TyrS-associated PheT N-terminal domain-related protein TapR n=1 Tax=Mycoplasma sp. 744 TaxID=3108531 RepID=UPI002B1D5F0A|nr:hypothetical protein [Mycoplasma sp. 744]MEA4115641.1 hypothetical protein [Mycoplasma sp. 744]